mgnify:CR=1 FL=1
MLMDGKELAKEIKAKIKTEIDDIKKIHNINPMVATILVGDNPASQVYLNSQIKSYQDLGIGVQKYFFSEEISEAYLLNLIDKLNKDTEVDGIMINLPLPPQINATKVLNSIKLIKDVDGFKAENLGLLFQNNEGFTSPSTPAGIMALIEKYNIDKNELISKISDLNDELDNIFKKSRELYSNIKELDSIYIKELGKPINLDDFETFIISSVTNGKSLSNIWSVAKMAINNGDEVSFNILWQYFKEMISLHNKAKGEDVFTIDNVQIGDTYSVHDHESKNENISYGHVSKIYILGFTNSFIGKRVEKSYVLIEE